MERRVLGNVCLLTKGPHASRIGKKVSKEQAPSCHSGICLESLSFDHTPRTLRSPAGHSAADNASHFQDTRVSPVTASVNGRSLLRRISLSRFVCHHRKMVGREWGGGDTGDLLVVVAGMLAGRQSHPWLSATFYISACARNCSHLCTLLHEVNRDLLPSFSFAFINTYIKSVSQIYFWQQPAGDTSPSYSHSGSSPASSTPPAAGMTFSLKILFLICCDE
jgi:hypothetical protein